MKSLGITFAFFGMVATIAAIADMNTGRYDTQNLLQTSRGSIWILLGLLLFSFGMFLVKRDNLHDEN